MTAATDWLPLALLAFCWLAYFLLHSLLASSAVKDWVASKHRRWVPGFRFAYNVFASLSLAPILILVFTAPGPVLWAWHGAAAWLANGLALAALFGVWTTMKHYDSQEFLGLRQWRTRAQRMADDDRFHLSPFHRHVRHPWYFCSLVLIWTRDMNAAMLLSAVAMTLYFIIGSRLEERKLLVTHGEAYRRYTRRVPGLFPWPGKSLSPREAAALTGSKADRDEPSRRRPQ